MIKFINQEPLLESLSDAEKATFYMAATLAAGTNDAVFQEVYCTESDQNIWTQEDFEQAHDNPVVKITSMVIPGHGGYFEIDIGAGWFAWGIGYPVMSACMGYYATVDAL